MLLELRISNFGIIDQVSIELDGGLTAITGETGAGKSMLVDALSAALGVRLGVDALRHGADSAAIEAVFMVDEANSSTKERLSGLGFDQQEEIVSLRRELNAGGRTLARVNGRAMPASTLSEVSDTLIDLHGQSEHLSLLRRDRQLDMLDHFAGLDGLRREFAAQAQLLRRLRQEQEEMVAQRRSNEQRLDLLRFQVAEIDGAGLTEDEEERLKAERLRLANAEHLALLAASVHRVLAGDQVQPGGIEALETASRDLAELARIDPDLKQDAETIEDLRHQVREVASAVRRYQETVEFDPARLADVEARLDEIARLERKYGDGVPAVLAFRDEATRQTEAIEQYDERLEQLEAQAGQLEAEAVAVGSDLSARRREAAERFAREVTMRLDRLGLNHAQFTVELDQQPDPDGIGPAAESRMAFGSTGIDQIRFQVAFNAGEPLRPLEKVASGGETARFMLAVKAVLAASDDVPTLVFDEIDTGVGARGGQVVGEMLRELAASHQVIVITHLPQIAALAGTHLKVAKHQTAGSTSVTVERLDGSRRVAEIAEMLAGARAGEGARRSAEELLAAR